MNLDFVNLLSHHIRLVKQFHEQKGVQQRVELTRELEDSMKTLWLFPSKDLSDSDLRLLQQAENYVQSYGAKG